MVAMKQLISLPRKHTLHQLNTYRRSNHLCDVVLVCDGREFPAHKAVLAAGGGFFHGLFAAKMKEEADRKVELLQVNPGVMDHILGFIYTGEMELTQENAQLVLSAADFLLLEELKRPVDKFLAEIFRYNPPSPQDRITFLQFAYQFNCYFAKKEILKQMCENFEAFIIQTHELFLELSAQALKDIISSDDLVVSNEELVFHAIIKWIRNEKDREKFLDEMLSQLRLCSLSKDFIHSVILTDAVVSSSPNSMSYLQNTKNTNTPATPNVPHPRNCLDKYTDVILVVPESIFLDNYCVTNGVWCYIPTTATWLHIPTPPKFGYGKPIYIGDSTIVAIEEDSNDVIVEKYDLNSNTWSLVVNWETEVSRYMKTYLKGVVYLVGGSKVNDDSVRDASEFVFAYDLLSNTNSFKQVASMNTPRESPHVVSNASYIYVLGGTTSFINVDDETDTMERYDPASDTWSYLSPVPFCNINGSPEQCTIANGKIYVVQKEDSDKDKKFDLVYNIGTDTWSKIPPAPISAKCGSLVHCQDKLYLICGGYSEAKYEYFKEGNIIQTVSYDLKENIWSDVGISEHIQVRFMEFCKRFLSTSDGIRFTGTAVRLNKDFVSTLKLLKDVLPETEHFSH